MSLSDTQKAMLSVLFEKLANLKNGWLDGYGVALDQNRLIEFKDQFLKHYPNNVLIPMITPTIEGGIFLEWHTEGMPSVTIELETMKASYHRFSSNGLDQEQEFELVNDIRWKKFCNFILCEIKVVT